MGTLVYCRKRKRKAEKALEECCLVGAKWEDLDFNILKEIFSLAAVEDLFWNVSAVCQSWEAACWDLLFWSRDVLDLGATSAGLGGVINLVTFRSKSHASGSSGPFLRGLESPENYNQMATSLMRKLKRIFVHKNSINGYSLQSWRLSIQTLFLPYDLEISDEHLLYIARRTPCLKNLFLLDASRITVNGFAKAIHNWNLVKDLHLGRFNATGRYKQFIKNIGKSCQKLESLHIHECHLEVDKSIVTVISESLPRLKRLEFESVDIYPSCIEALFQKCFELEEVHFMECYKVDAYDVRPGLQERPTGCVSFYLNWTIDGRGRAKWEVRPSYRSGSDLYTCDDWWSWKLKEIFIEWVACAITI